MAKPAQPVKGKVTRRDAFRAQRQSKDRRNRVVWISIATLAALVVAAILILPNLPVNTENLQTPKVLVRTTVDGNSMGDPAAPVKVVEYSDFNCVHCKNFWVDQTDKFISDYVETGKVYFQYVPFSFISPTSFTAAEAVYCAMDQNMFWQYHDYIFANYGAEFTSPMLKAIAQAVGLDMSTFNKCLNSGKYQLKVQQDLQTGQGQGVNSTPTFFVNGEKTDSVNLSAMVEKALSGN
jgi:protein-disulfide isomerase